MILTRMMSDIEQLQTLLQDGYSQFAIQLLTMVIVSTVLFSYNVELALITVFIVVPALLVLSAWFRRASDRGYLRVRNGIAGVLSDLSETLQGIRVIAGVQPPARQRRAPPQRRRRPTARPTTTRADRRVLRADDRVHRADRTGPDPLIGGTMVLNGELSVGELTAFVLYIAAFFQPIQQLVQTYNMYQAGKSALVKLRELLATDPSVVESPDAYPLPPVAGEHRVRGGHVRLRRGQPRPPRRRPADLRRRDGRPRRPDRCRQVDARQARPAVLRPDGGSRPDRRTRPPARFASSRCAGSSASCRRSRSCSPDRSATTSPSPVRARPTTSSTRRSISSACVS